MSLVMFTARAGANVPIPVKALESGGQQLDLRVVSLDSLIHLKVDSTVQNAGMGTGDQIPRCPPANSKDSQNKRSIYKLLKQKTKNSHNKYKLQAIIGVIKWHFMFLPHPQTPTKNLKRPQRLPNDQSHISCSEISSSQDTLGVLPACSQAIPAQLLLPCPQHGLKQDLWFCKLGSELTRVQARKLETNYFRTQVDKFLSFCFFKVPNFPKRKH